MNRIITSTYQSPCGSLLLGSFGGRLCICDWQENGDRGSILQRLTRYLDVTFEEGISDVIDMACAELEEYFEEKRRSFDIPILLVGTEFQKKVWNELISIPYGSHVTYQNIADDIGNPKAVRAVAKAIGDNALSIILPCHRVIGSNGCLTGYAGGLEAKEYLLNLEHIEDASYRTQEYTD